MTEQERIEVESSDERRAMQEQKITLLLLLKLAGREPVTITAADVAKAEADFAGSMPVLYCYESPEDGALTYQVIDAKDVEAIQADAAQRNAERLVGALRPGSYPQGRVGVDAARKAIEAAGGKWPDPGQAP